MGKLIKRIFPRLIGIEKQHDRTACAEFIHSIGQQPVISGTAQSRRPKAAFNNAQSVHNALAYEQGSAVRKHFGGEIKNSSPAVLAVFIAARSSRIGGNIGISHLIAFL